MTGVQELIDAVGALVAADPGRLGHRRRPVADKDIPIIERANAGAFHTNERQSLICWDCALRDDEARWNSQQTVGEHTHLMFERWAAVRTAYANLEEGDDE